MILSANDLINYLGSAGVVIVVKRSLSPGFAGVDNSLFYDFGFVLGAGILFRGGAGGACHRR